MYPVIRLPFLVVICLVWILTGNGANRANEFVEQAMPQATPEMTATSGEVSAKQASQETGDPSPDMTGETWIAKGIPPKRNPKVTWYQSLSVEKMWNQLSDLENRNVALGTLKCAELNRGYFNGIVLISEKEIQEFRGQLLKISGVLQGEESSKDSQMPIMPDGQRYPAIILHIQSIDALAKIVRLPFIESVEPEFVAASGVGCSLSTYTPNPADGMLFDNRVPWSFKHMGVVDAWNLYKVNNAFYSPGYPIRIGVVDTGVYQDEQQLTTFFESSGFRSPAHNLTVVPQACDDCGHGTRIAGLATAPADTQNIYARKIVGVAWGANLTTVKYNDSVIAWAGSRFALVNAIYLAVGDGSQIVNLALAMPYWSTFVYDNIDTVYRTTQTIFV